MKPFNLEEYLENPTKEIITKKGRKVRILCTDRKDSTFPIVALVEGEDNIEETMHYTKDGERIIDCDRGNDLFFVPEKHEGYINIFKDKNGSTYVNNSSIYQSKETAKYYGMAFTNYVTTVKIEWEE